MQNGLTVMPPRTQAKPFEPAQAPQDSEAGQSFQQVLSQQHAAKTGAQEQPAQAGSPQRHQAGATRHKPSQAAADTSQPAAAKQARQETAADADDIAQTDPNPLPSVAIMPTVITKDGVINPAKSRKNTADDTADAASVVPATLNDAMIAALHLPTTPRPVTTVAAANTGQAADASPIATQVAPRHQDQTLASTTADSAPKTEPLAQSNPSPAQPLPLNEAQTLRLAAKLAAPIQSEPSPQSPVVPMAALTPQPSALLLTQNNQPLNSTMIQATPGKAGWDQAISQKVVWMVGQAEQSATLTLNPPDLGPLQVVIHVNNDKADTTFISDHPEVRKALENGIAHLRQSMDQAGIQLGQTNINDSRQSPQFQQGSSSPAFKTASPQPIVEAPTLVAAPRLARVHNGLVDTFA